MGKRKIRTRQIARRAFKACAAQLLVNIEMKRQLERMSLRVASIEKAFREFNEEEEQQASAPSAPTTSYGEPMPEPGNLS